MRLGEATFAPLGYLEFCTRRPDQCQAPARAIPAHDVALGDRFPAADDDQPSVTPAAAPDPAQNLVLLPELLTAAPAVTWEVSENGTLSPASSGWFAEPSLRRVSWSTGQAVRPFDSVYAQPLSGELGMSAVIYSDGPPPAALPTRMMGATEANVLAPNADERAVSPRQDFRRPRVEKSALEQPFAAKAGALHKSSELMALLDRTNQRINAAIKPASDLKVFGVAEYWDLPLDPGGKGVGNCKDYVLQKREELIRMGVAAEALSIAVVRTSWGESHAVLIVTTDAGEFVLDNLTPWVTPWYDLNYTWIERQRPGGGPTDWVSLDGNKGAA